MSALYEEQTSVPAAICPASRLRLCRALITPSLKSVGQQLRERDADIAALKADLAAMRAEFNTARRLDEVGARLERLEGRTDARLRLASS